MMLKFDTFSRRVHLMKTPLVGARSFRAYGERITKVPFNSTIIS